MTDHDMRLEILVDELVVRGLSPADARIAAAALKAQLAELASAHPTSVRSRAESSRRLPGVEVRSGSPGEVGQAVGRAVWIALGGRQP